MRFIDPQHDAWHVSDGATVPSPDHVLNLEQWQSMRGQWPSDTPAAVVVPNDVDIESLEAALPRLALIVLQFPKWTDGRAYSQARLLRSRFGFKGEIRATGEVLVDMLPLLHRTGFDAVQLRPDQSLDSAHRALRFFAGHYQGDVNEPRPLFGRTASELFPRVPA